MLNIIKFHSSDVLWRLGVLNVSCFFLAMFYCERIAVVRLSFLMIVKPEIENKIIPKVLFFNFSFLVWTLVKLIKIRTFGMFSITYFGNIVEINYLIHYRFETWASFLLHQPKMKIHYQNSNKKNKFQARSLYTSHEEVLDMIFKWMMTHLLSYDRRNKTLLG